MQCHCHYQLQRIAESRPSHTSGKPPASASRPPRLSEEVVAVAKDACHLRLQVPIIVLLLLALRTAALLGRGSGRRSAAPQRRELRLHTTTRLSNPDRSTSWWQSCKCASADDGMWLVASTHLLLVDLLLYAVAHDSVGGAAQRARQLLDTTADLTHPRILPTDGCQEPIQKTSLCKVDSKSKHCAQAEGSHCSSPAATGRQAAMGGAWGSRRSWLRAGCQPAPPRPHRHRPALPPALSQSLAGHRPHPRPPHRDQPQGPPTPQQQRWQPRPGHDGTAVSVRLAEIRWAERPQPDDLLCKMGLCKGCAPVVAPPPPPR